VHFDPALPINARRDEIRAAIDAHPIVIVCGETGSGKTTQLPIQAASALRSKVFGRRDPS
jgi:ATP-dependent helicase HrpA